MVRKEDAIKIIKKKAKLEKACYLLKEEFFGIDSVIDQLIEAYSAWYLFPGVQDAPLVINLWGMTGVGKTSLVARLVELTEMKERYFHLDVAEYTDKYHNVCTVLDEVHALHSGKPIIIALDEFQHAKTVGYESNQMKTQLIWQLMDSKSITYVNYDHRISDLTILLQRLEYLQKKGVRAEKGIVVKGKSTYLNRMNKYLGVFQDESEQLRFLPPQEYDCLSEWSSAQFKSALELEDHILKLNDNETIVFLRQLLKECKRPKQIDCSQTLIIVMGNIDEAYAMQGEMNPDIPADDYHESSTDMNIGILKSALRQRFRSEQIARLGNNLIFYPALNREAFCKIIETQLNEIAGKVLDQYGLTIEFSDDIKALLYDEGVYPAQGARPLLSTIHHIVKSNLGFLLSEIYSRDEHCNRVIIRSDDEKIVFECYEGNNRLFELNRPLMLKLVKNRKANKDDIQSIIAVHESGHAVLSAVLLGVVPELVLSRMAVDATSGVTLQKIPWKYVSKKEIRLRLAVMLGGYAAERLVFGDDNVTAGSESDFEMATGFASAMIKVSGMGDRLGNYNVHDFRVNMSLFDPKFERNDEIILLMEDARQLAESTLMKYKHPLVIMANVLSDKVRMEQTEIRELMQKYAPEGHIIPLNGIGSSDFYRHRLKQKTIEVLNERRIQKIKRNPVTNKHKRIALTQSE